MAGYQRISVIEKDDIQIVHFNENRLLDLLVIENVGQELYRLSSEANCAKLLLSFAEVESLSTSMLGKLIMLNKRMKAHGGKLVLCAIKPQIREVFAMTNLDRILDIRENEALGLATLSD